MNIIITGASRGIGYSLIKRFIAFPGVKIIAISRNASRLNELLQSCIPEHVDTEIITVPYDINDTINSAEEFRKTISQYANNIHLLINNAGKLIKKPFEEFTLKEASEIFKTNVFGTAFLIKALLPFMGGDIRTHVVNIGSMAGYQGSSKYSGLSYYSASKAALACMTECLAQEYANRNIYFNCLALGAVQTEMLAEAFPGYKAPVRPDEMADFIADFSLNGHRIFNGKVLPVALSNP